VQSVAASIPAQPGSAPRSPGLDPTKLGPSRIHLRLCRRRCHTAGSPASSAPRSASIEPHKAWRLNAPLPPRTCAATREQPTDNTIGAERPRKYWPLLQALGYDPCLLLAVQRRRRRSTVIHSIRRYEPPSCLASKHGICIDITQRSAHAKLYRRPLARPRGGGLLPVTVYRVCKACNQPVSAVRERASPTGGLKQSPEGFPGTTLLNVKSGVTLAPPSAEILKPQTATFRFVIPGGRSQRPLPARRSLWFGPLKSRGCYMTNHNIVSIGRRDIDELPIRRLL